MKASAVLAFLLTVPVSGIAAGAIPQSEGARTIESRGEEYGAAFIRGINSDDGAERREIADAIFAQETLDEAGAERLLGLFARLRESFGVLEYHHSEVTYKVLHVFARKEGATRWHDFQLRLSPEPPHKIRNIGFVAEVAEPVYLPNGGIASAEVLDWLNGYVDKLIAENDLSGSMLIAQGDQVIFERAFGFADAGRELPVTPETRFSLGSGNKMFTAIAVAQLEAAGKLSYEDRLSKYFPDFPEPEFAQRATVGQLLSHTSGLGDYWTEEYEQAWGGIRTLAQMLPFVYAVPTRFQPGAAFGYSNSGFILAGLIVEQVSGQTYYEYVREHVLEPLGMNSTDWYLTDGSVAGLAQPLARGDEGWVRADRSLRGNSAGGGFSTPRDMLRFSRGLAAGELLPPESMADLLRSQVPPQQPGFDYGYGFILARDGDVRSYGHGGLASGVNMEFRYFPSLDTTFVIFCNQDNGAYDDLRKNGIKLITGDR